MSRPVFFGGGGGGSKSSSSPLPDSFKTRDTVEIIMGLCEGPIWGPSEGARSIFLDTTPIVNASGFSNFKNLVVIFYPGSEIGEQIKPKLGGFSNPFPVNVSLEKNVAVVRTGVQTQIDFIEVRLAVQALYANDTSKGAIQTTGQVKVEYKRSDSATWLPAFLETGPSPATVTGPAGSEAVYEVNDPYDVTDAVGSVIVAPSTTPPPPPYIPEPVGVVLPSIPYVTQTVIPPVLWIAPDIGWQPHIFNPAPGVETWQPVGTWDPPNTQWIFDSPFEVNPDDFTNRVRLNTSTTPDLGWGSPGDILVNPTVSTVLLFDGDSWSPPRGGAAE